MTKKTPEATRAKLLQAAITIIVEQGAAHLTLNAVAHTAQVSKGGLLHHFPTKEALLYGIDDLATQMWSTRLQHALAQEPEGQPGRWSRAYIRACFDRQPEENRVLLALTRIIGVYPHVIERWRAMYAQAGAHMSDDGLPAGRALTIHVACDGLWLGEMVGLPLIPDTQRAAVRADLLRLTRDS
jgi:AcrR family transcriptional regulator